MGRPVSCIRLLLVSSICVPAAVIAGAHALSSATWRQAPDFAVVIFPFNGLAHERLSYRRFVEQVRREIGKSSLGKDANGIVQPTANQPTLSSDADIENFARSAKRAVKKTLKLEPLSPKAYALLALSEDNPTRRRRIILLGARASRRDISVQMLALRERALINDYSGAIVTLDQILRVHPKRQSDFFPILRDALRRDETTLAFINMLKEPTPWRDRFLIFAAADKASRPNLANIRRRIYLDNKLFDQLLVQGLVEDGQIQLAGRVYRFVSKAPTKGSMFGSSKWISVFPPFDWLFTNRPGLRAQPSEAGEKLHVNVEPGDGGTIASRLLPAPSVPFSINLSVSGLTISQIQDTKLSIACWGQSTPFFEQNFASENVEFTISKMPDCSFLKVSIMTRSWSGGRALAGTFGAFVVRQR